MKTVTQELIDFVTDTKFEDLPGEVVHECKRIILDCCGIGLAALGIDKGKISVALARRLGGPPEASIIGIGDKVACANAAFANGELVFAMDYCNILYPVIHASENIVPSLLAVGEHLGSSGRDLILATALAHEIPTRLQYGMDNRWQGYVTEGPDKGKLTNPDVAGVGVNTFGGTIGVGRLLKLNRDQMAHAIGIAGYNQPVPTYGKWTRTRKGGMMKWGSAGWICHTAVIAALLAEMGYTADQTVLEGDHGFWRYYGSATWDPDKVTEKLGERWQMIEIMWYKAYPSGGIIHSALEVFTRIIEENNLFPGDINKVTVWADPLTAMARFQDREIETEIDAQFNTAYEFAARAYRIPLEDWQNLNNIRNPKIKEFMQKVTNHAHPEFGKIMLETPQARIAKVEVEAKGKTFVDEGVFVRGQSYRGRTYPEKARQTDDWLIDKFRRNAARVLPSYKMDKAPQAILELENMGNVSDLMKLVTI